MTATTFSDDFRDRIESAREAVLDLLRASEPDSWVSLRAGYGELRGALARDDKQRELEERKREKDERWERKLEVEDEAKGSWRQLSAAARESLLLQVLGDERLILRQLTDRLNAELGHPTKPVAVYQGHVRSLVMRMFGAGQLEREPETFNKTHTRYRYFRRRMVDGPIVDLERAYHEGSDA